MGDLGEANSELQERELLKRARLAATMADALRARGTDDTTARLAAEMGMLAFSTAYARWAAPENRRPFAEIAHAALADLQARAATLGTNTGMRVQLRFARDQIPGGRMGGGLPDAAPAPLPR
jgi:uncharacterized protein (DUF2336 family)